MNHIVLPQLRARRPPVMPIIASWQRSADSGVSPEAREAPVAIVGLGFEDLRWRYRELRTAATPIFLATQDLLTDSRSMMVLTSADGIVLDVAGNTQTLDAGERIHLMPGGDWREATIGTNGIGMALSTRAPAHVHGDEHFCEVVKYWTCAAAPVREPGTGTILGVLDISGPPQTYHRNNLTLAVTAARQIETALAGLRARERAQLLEACLVQLSSAMLVLPPLGSRPAPLVQGGTASLDDVEHGAIKQALEAARGNVAEAARVLGISRSTLYRKVQRHGLVAKRDT